MKIDFKQTGANGDSPVLPAGSRETISAGGGRSPGHHEGGGITVRVRKD